ELGGAGIVVEDGEIGHLEDVTWSGGDLAGGGILRVEPGTSLELSQSSNWTIDGTDLINFGGTVTWSGNGSLTLIDATLLNTSADDFTYGTHVGTFVWTGSGNLNIEEDSVVANIDSYDGDNSTPFIFEIRTDGDILSEDET